MVVVSGGSKWWQWVVAVGGGSGWWQWVVVVVSVIVRLILTVRPDVYTC